MRYLRLLVLFLFLLGAETSTAAPKVALQDFNKVESVQPFIEFLNEVPESGLANANGSVVGVFAVWRLRSPENYNSWLQLASSRMLKAQMVAAVSLAISPDAAKTAADEHEVDWRDVMRVSAFPGGNAFLSTPVSSEAIPFAGATLSNFMAEKAWHQDVLWGAAFASRDGAYVKRLLASIDLQFASATSASAPELIAFAAAGAWSTNSNRRRFDFVEAAFQDYARQHAGSVSVKLITRQK